MEFLKFMQQGQFFEPEGGEGKPQAAHIAQLSNRNNGEVGGEEPPTEPPVETPPVKPAEGEPPPEPTTPVEGEEPATPAEGEETPPDLDVIEYLAQLTQPSEPAPPSASEPTPGEPAPSADPQNTPPAAQAPSATDEAFDLEEQTFVKMFENKDVFVGVMKKLMNQITAPHVSEAVKSTVTELNSGLQKAAREEVVVQMAAQNFWSQNPDLKKISNLVVMQANKILTAEPKLPLDQVYDKAGKEVRGIIQKIQQNPEALQTPPDGNGNFIPAGGGAGAPRGKPAKPKLTSTQAQIKELVEFKNRR